LVTNSDNFISKCKKDVEKQKIIENQKAQEGRRKMNEKMNQLEEEKKKF
jgi:hypothetical protein